MVNVIQQPDIYTKPLQNWYDKAIAPLLGTQPQIGELRIKWYTTVAHAEQSGEIVTVERWNGDGWEQYGLDAHSTVEELLTLEEILNAKN